MSENNIMNEKLKKLRLPWIRDNYKAEIEYAIDHKLNYQDFLARLVDSEISTKQDNAVNRRIRTAGFPQIKRLEEFDFAYQPDIDSKLVRELAGLDFLDQARNLIFLGPPGVGKTHLAISLGIKACEAARKVAFYTTAELTELLAQAEVTGIIKQTVAKLARLDLLIIDELGYLELTKKTATLFFQIIAARYERTSLIITSNKSFEQWGTIFQDEVVAAAIIDRLLHHSHRFIIKGKSFRMKNVLKKAQL